MDHHTETVRDIEHLLVVMIALLEEGEFDKATACLEAVVKLCRLYPDLTQMFNETLEKVKRELYH